MRKCFPTWGKNEGEGVLLKAMKQINFPWLRAQSRALIEKARILL